MSAPAIRIRVGASLDANTANVFKPLVQAARDARMAVEDEMAKMYAAINGKSVGPGRKKGGPFRSIPDEAAKAADKVIKEEQKKQDRIAREEQRAEERRKRQRESAERYVAGIKDRYLAQEQKDREKADADTVGKREKRIRAILGGTSDNLKKAGGAALGLAGSVARGAGVQLDLGAYVGQAVDLETRATELSSAAYSGEGERRDPKALVSLARKVGNDAAFDPTKAIEGLQAFVGKTGDLATGEASLPALAKLARATGTSLEDMISAAGDAAMALGEVGPGKDFETAAEKGKKLSEVMRMIAGQGKVGAVEIKDLATQMAKIGSSATAFGGDATKNIEFMGALAQMARASGGAASATQAATAVSGFVSTLKTPARAKEFKAAGVDIFDKNKNLRDPRSIILDSLSSTKGDPLAFKKLFANVTGARTVEPAAVEYRNAYARAKERKLGDKEADAYARGEVGKLFDKFTKPISAGEETESFNRSMDTSAAKVQLFNNKLSEIGARVAEKVLPALEKMAPTIVKLADGAAKFIDFAVDNPGKAAGLALAASIGKASIDTVVKEGIDKLISGAASSAGASKGLGALSIVATAITIGAVGKLIIDSVTDSSTKGVTTSVEADARAGNALSALRGAERTGNEEQARAALESGKEQISAMETRIQAAQDPTSFLGALFGSKTFEQRSMEQNDAQHLDQLKADLAALKGEMAKVSEKLGGTLKTQDVSGSRPRADVAATTK